MGNLNYNNNDIYNTYMLRGGSLYNAHANFPAVFRGSGYATDTHTVRGFRVILYIK